MNTYTDLRYANRKNPITIIANPIRANHIKNANLIYVPLIMIIMLRFPATKSQLSLRI